MTTVFDIETDGLLDELTKIHVLSWSNDMGEVKHTHDYDEMRYVLLNSETLVGHNIIRFDIPAVEKLLDIKVTARLVDTLALSWYGYRGMPTYRNASMDTELTAADLFHG